MPVSFSSRTARKRLAPGCVVEVDHPGAGGLLVALGVPILDRHSGAEQTVEVPVVLHYGTADIVDRQLPQRVIYGGGR